MKKAALVVVGVIFLIVTSNLVGWLIFGGNTAILIAVESFDSAGAVTSNDTLYVFTGRVSDIESGRQLGSSSRGIQERFVQRLREEANVSRVLLHSGTFEISESNPIDYTENEAAFFASVDHSLPMYAVVETIVYTPGFVVVHKKKGIWFFGWWLISDRVDSIS